MNASNANESRSGFKVTAASEIESGQQNWLWPGRIGLPSIALLAGRGGVGKSTILAAIAGAVTAGRKLGSTTTPKESRGGVLWLSAEENLATTVRPRLQAAKADMAKVYFPGTVVNGSVHRQIELPGDLPLVREIIVELNIRLVVVDPIASYTPSIDLNQQQSTRQLMGGLRLLSEEQQMTWLLVAHPNKSRTGPVIDRIFGSASMIHCARTVLLAAHHPSGDGRRVICHAKSNEGALAPALAYRIGVVGKKQPVTHIEWEGVCEVSLDMLGVEAMNAGEQDTHRDARDLLKQLLRDWRPATEVIKEAAAAGIGERSLRDAKAELMVRSRRVADGFTPAHWEWGPPEKGWDES